MSAKIIGKVWELDLEPVEKLVLLALADHADHEGNNVRPGNDLLIAKTGLSQQTISAKITKFIEMGILEPTKDGRGRGVIREFSIEPERAERKPFFIEREERKLQATRTYRKAESHNQGVPSEAKRYNLTEEKVQADSEKVQFDKIAYKEENRHEPSIERERESTPPISKSILSVLIVHYKDIANDYKSEMSLKNQATLLDGKYQVADLEAWLASRRSLSSIGFIASDFKMWLANQFRQKTNGQQSDSPRQITKAPTEYLELYRGKKSA